MPSSAGRPGRGNRATTQPGDLTCRIGESHDLNFVLVDYKGGSAFDACASLPHTVGLVTDLDDHLAGRALVCLEAELRYREDVSGRQKSPTSANSQRVGPPATAPARRDRRVRRSRHRASDFMNALVGIAQRGRSLGVHLPVGHPAPQRCHRRQDQGQHQPAHGSAGSGCRRLGRRHRLAGSRRHRPQPAGRAFARLGPGDTVAFQTALVTGRSLAQRAFPVSPYPFVFVLSRAHPELPPATR